MKIGRIIFWYGRSSMVSMVSMASMASMARTILSIGTFFFTSIPIEIQSLYTSDFFISRPLIGRAIGVVNLYDNWTRQLKWRSQMCIFLETCLLGFLTLNLVSWVEFRPPLARDGRHSTQLNSLSLVIRRRANMSPIFYTCPHSCSHWRVPLGQHTTLHPGSHACVACAPSVCCWLLVS